MFYKKRIEKLEEENKKLKEEFEKLNMRLSLSSLLSLSRMEVDNLVVKKNTKKK